jgi:hypothetical protein
MILRLDSLSVNAFCCTATWQGAAFWGTGLLKLGTSFKFRFSVIPGEPRAIARGEERGFRRFST